MSATAVAATTKLPKIPPSTFSVLLRRSRFASYDPKIGQIYTTYGGSASRGDWGLKRPLPVRRRDGRLIISSIDTMYQQTEWKSAYSDAETVRKFEELGVTPKVGFRTDWGPQFGYVGLYRQPTQLHDSDFVDLSGVIESHLEMKVPLPDTRTMSPRRFERYLRKLRRLHPDFRERIGKEKNEPFHRLAQHAEYKMFIGERIAEAYKKEDSSIIRPMPHPAAGLTYNNRHVQLQNAIHAKSFPGRRLHEQESKREGSTTAVNVDLGGWVSSEEVSIIKNRDVQNGVTKLNIPMVDYGTTEGEPRTDLDAGVDTFRATSCVMFSSPKVVGKYPQRLESTVLAMDVKSWSGAENVRPNPFKPGTQMYTAHEEEDDNKGKKNAASRTDGKYRPNGTFSMTNYSRSRTVRGGGKGGAGQSVLFDTIQLVRGKLPRPDGKGKGEGRGS